MVYVHSINHSATIFSAGPSSLKRYSRWWSRKYSLDLFTSRNML